MFFVEIQILFHTAIQFSKYILQGLFIACIPFTKFLGAGTVLADSTMSSEHCNAKFIVGT